MASNETRGRMVGIVTSSITIGMFSLTDSERSRLNTAFVVSNFLFSAIFSSLTAFLWNIGSWQAVTFGATVAALIALAAHSEKFFIRIKSERDG